MNFVTSKYVQICDWALIEYEYSSMDPTSHGSIPSTGSSDAVGIYRLTNNISGEYQFCNYSYGTKTDLRNTGNSLAWNLIPVNATQSKWATSNILASSKYNPIDNPNYILDDKSNDIISYSSHEVRYDTIRIHVLSGYNLEGIDGFILNVSFLENSKKKMKASSAAYLRNGSFQEFKFNSNPIMMGERMYDKYISVKVPSLYQIQAEYSGSTNLYQFANLYSHPSIPTNPNPGGYLKDSTIYLSLSEILANTTDDQVDFYTLKQTFNTSILQADTYSFLSCTVRESEDGDFYEYFPTWQGEFIEDYMNMLNGINGSNGYTWTVIHNLKVIEQIGTDFFTTSDLTIPQSSNFTKPSYFRPIITRANEAFAYSILYTIRLVNGSTGEQVLRVCNVSNYNPKKYGFDMKKINIDEGLQPMKVYNKIVNETTSQNNSIIRSENLFTVKYIPQYISYNSIAVNMSNSIAPQIDNIVYGQGKCILQLNKYDNVLKFTILNIKGTGLLPLNLASSKIYLRFSLDNDQDINISSVISENIHPEMGEIVFNVLKEDALKILNIKKDKSFYLIAKQDSGGIETVIYTGKFEKFVDGREIDIEMVKPLQIKLNEEQALITAVKTKLDEDSKTLQKELDKYKRLQKELADKIAEYQKHINELNSTTTKVIPKENLSTQQHSTVSGKPVTVSPIKFVVPVSQQQTQQNLTMEQIIMDTNNNLESDF